MGKTKACSYGSEPKDHMTELRNEVLDTIQKFLPIKQAILLSEISNRFKNSWKTCPYLTLNSNSVLNESLNSLSRYDLDQLSDFMEKRADKFVKKVNKITELHYGKGIECFNVNFTLNSVHSNSIDKWVKFAIYSDTKELTLNLTENILSIGKRYKFPHRYFTATNSNKFHLKTLTLAACSFKVPENCTGLSLIETLNLTRVKLSDTDLTNLISICAKLGYLRLQFCISLVNLVISHASDKLKYLRVDCERELESIYIHDCNGLSMFEYSGYNACDLKVKLIRVPKLSRVSAFLDETGPTFSLENYLNDPLNYVNGSLEKLFLLLKAPFEVSHEPCFFNSFDNLKDLVLKIVTPRSESFLWVIWLLKATPFVEKIHLEIQATEKPQKKTKKTQTERWSKSRKEERKSDQNENTQNERWTNGKKEEIKSDQNGNFPLIFLRSIKIGGLIKAEPKQIELIMCLVKNSPALESLIIDTRMHYYIGQGKWERTELEIDEKQLSEARAKAERIFSEKIPSHVDLKVF